MDKYGVRCRHRAGCSTAMNAGVMVFNRLPVLFSVFLVACMTCLFVPVTRAQPTDARFLTQGRDILQSVLYAG